MSTVRRDKSEENITVIEKSVLEGLDSVHHAKLQKYNEQINK